ncbi:MAG TPA: hypothetical protein PLU91_06875 [Verrucomicrobiota bacterium]|nr:hypothetical protein [Verrucomicrobiota bacterium]
MNPMPGTSLRVKQMLIKGCQLWRSAGSVARLTILGLGLAGGLPIAAQEPDAEGHTNDLAAAELLARISELVEAAESGQVDDMAQPEDLTATNGAPQTSAAVMGDNRVAQGALSADGTNRSQISSRSPKDDRRSRGRRSSRPGYDSRSSPRSASDHSRGDDRAPASTPDLTNSAPPSLEYSAFKVIVDRNIFDPNRYPRRAGEPRARPVPKTVDSVTLVGTMSYEKGWFAFFDGSSSEFKKALKLTDTIAGYKVAAIAPTSVNLAAGTNRLELKVGMQMRREEDGPWMLSAQSGPHIPAPPSTSTNAAAMTTVTGSNAVAGDTESDIIKRLMQKRLQE